MRRVLAFIVSLTCCFVYAMPLGLRTAMWGIAVNRRPPFDGVLVLTAGSADWSSGSITLCCVDVDASSEENKYTLEYKNENDEWEEVDGAKAVAATKELDANGHQVCVAKLTDTAFSTRLGGIPPVEYRVKDENGRVSEGCVTRNRFLLSVGYDAYKKILGLVPWVKPMRQSLADATELRRLCVEKGGFSHDNAMLLSNSGAKMEDVRNAIGVFASRAKSGDLFMLYMATHGDDYSDDATANICAYDVPYYVGALQSDIRKFSSGVAIVGVIMACHSQSMTGKAEDHQTQTTMHERINAWLVKCGFGQCLGNVAWIVSCDSAQNSWNSEAYTLFGQSFIHDGFMNGYADAELYGVEFDGVEYKGENTDGVITLGELGRYAGAFAKGISDDWPSDVKLENAGLLDRIIIAKGIVPSRLNRPEPPVGVVATQGTFDFRTRVSWSASETATGYRVYRYPQGMPLAGKWVETTFGATSADDFPTSFADKLGVAMSQSILGVKYLYYVKAINPVGVSEPSSLVEGWRGTTSFLSYLAGIIGAAPASITTEEYDAVENATAANGCRTVGECYALGINPEDPNDDLKINHFEMKDGKPVITLNHTEDGSGNSFVPRVKTLGKANLNDSDWVEVPESGDPSMRFFKVDVEMP